MSLEEEAKMLRNIGLFAHLDPSKLKLLAFTSHWLKFQPGEELCHEGDPGDSAYIITDGTAEVLVDSEAGPVLIAVRGKNEVIGEMSILCDTPRTATVRAKETCFALSVSKDVFMQLLKGSPELSVQIIRTLANRLEESTAKLRDATEKLVAAGLD
ncbi:MAG: cyclic nucleotide-binding domain-containing protein [Gammaproteobacteria bacterium]|nr:cyclic nucleotide-binding domain-containing protein [Gammaproteobacteria bacterium]